MFNGKIHYKLPFSIAMLVITRGYIICRMFQHVIHKGLIKSMRVPWFMTFKQNGNMIFKHLCFFHKSITLTLPSWTHQPIGAGSLKYALSSRKCASTPKMTSRIPEKHIKNTSEHQWNGVLEAVSSSHIILTSLKMFVHIIHIYIYGSVSKPCTPVVHIKIAGIYGCSFP